MKIVINKCYGGFGLSHEGVMEYAERSKLKLNAYINSRKDDGSIDFNKMEKYDGKSKEPLIFYSKSKLKADGTLPEKGDFSIRDIKRNDSNLIATVEKLGEKANSRYSNLKIVTIPDGVLWQIEEYDGLEHVAQQHETWG